MAAIMSAMGKPAATNRDEDLDQPSGRNKVGNRIDAA
jgi:hypothetical protein